MWRSNRSFLSLVLCQLFLIFCQVDAFSVHQNWVLRRRARFAQYAQRLENNPSEATPILSSFSLARASSLHETLLALRTELPRTAFAVGSTELYADDVMLVAETGEFLAEVNNSICQTRLGSISKSIC